MNANLPSRLVVAAVGMCLTACTTTGAVFRSPDSSADANVATDAHTMDERGLADSGNGDNPDTHIDVAFDASDARVANDGAMTETTVTDVSTDAPTDARDDARSDARADGGACRCGPESCEAATCGRSRCGYPCGTCPDSQTCVAGRCAAGPPGGTACADAFDVYPSVGTAEGGFGFRICPTDPAKVEYCTCGGGGPNDWIACSGTCVTPCSGTVRCGTSICAPTEFCQECASGSAPTTQTCRPREERFGLCPSPGSQTFDAFCDGNEDCAVTERCMGVVGDMVSMRCERYDRALTCGTSAGFYDLCYGDLSRCPPCATGCHPATFADGSTPASHVTLCR